jgi:hypothetical protein
MTGNDYCLCVYTETDNQHVTAKWAAQLDKNKKAKDKQFLPIIFIAR